MNKTQYFFSYFDIKNPQKNKQIVAKSYKDAKNKLLKQKIIPYKLTKKSKFSQKNWKKKDLLFTTKQLGLMLNAGLSLLNALNLLAQNHPNIAWRYLIEQITNDLLKGESFNKSLHKKSFVFPDFYLSLIKIAELTGNFEKCLSLLAKKIEKEIETTTKIKNACKYPIFILSSAFFIIIGMLIFLLPQFEQMYKDFNQNLPIATQILIELSHFLQKFGLLFALFFVLLFYGYMKNLRKKPFFKETEQTFLLSFPISKQIITSSFSYQFFYMLGIAQSSGSPLNESIDSIKKSTNWLAYKNSIEKMQQHILKGNSLFLHFDSDLLFPKICAPMIQIGEESGKLDEIFLSLANIFEKEFDDFIQISIKKIEPILMAFLGILIAGLIIAIYLPIFQLGTIFE